MQIESKLLILDHVTVELSWQLTTRAGAQTRTLHSPSLAAALKRVMSTMLRWNPTHRLTPPARGVVVKGRGLPCVCDSCTCVE
jgi:CBS-domain-containing membrane protein